MSKRPRSTRRPDGAMTPVIATILVVAITVGITAGAIFLFKGLMKPEVTPEAAAVRVLMLDTDGDGLDDWIKLTQVRGEHSPYITTVIRVELLSPTGEVLDQATAGGLACTEPDAAAGPPVTCAPGFDHFGDPSATWGQNDVLYLPCQDAGNHGVALSLRDTAVLSRMVECGEAAA